MTQFKQDATVFAGKSFSLQFTLTNSVGAPLDLTGAVVRWRAAYSRVPPALITKTTGGSGITVPSTGIALVAVAAGDIPNPAPSALYHELEVQLSGETAAIAACGRLHIIPVMG